MQIAFMSKAKRKKALYIREQNYFRLIHSTLQCKPNCSNFLHTVTYIAQFSILYWQLSLQHLIFNLTQDRRWHIDTYLSFCSVISHPCWTNKHTYKPHSKTLYSSSQTQTPCSRSFRMCMCMCMCMWAWALTIIQFHLLSLFISFFLAYYTFATRSSFSRMN